MADGQGTPPGALPGRHHDSDAQHRWVLGHFGINTRGLAGNPVNGSQPALAGAASDDPTMPVAGIAAQAQDEVTPESTLDASPTYQKLRAALGKEWTVTAAPNQKDGIDYEHKRITIGIKLIVSDLGGFKTSSPDTTDAASRLSAAVAKVLRQEGIDALAKPQAGETEQGFTDRYVKERAKEDAYYFTRLVRVRVEVEQAGLRADMKYGVGLSPISLALQPEGVVTGEELAALLIAFQSDRSADQGQTLDEFTGYLQTKPAARSTYAAEAKAAYRKAHPAPAPAKTNPKGTRLPN